MDNKHFQHEETLVERCKAGNFQAFRQLIERYQSRIYAVCYGVVRNSEDARDAVQEVLITIYKSMHKFKGESGLYVWIYRIAVNKSLDFCRKRKRGRKLFNRMTREMKVFSNNTSNAPDEVSLSLELKKTIAYAIEKLSDRHKSVIILREIEGLSYQEIAKILHCSQGTVMSRLFYARKRLLKVLMPYVGE